MVSNVSQNPVLLPRRVKVFKFCNIFYFDIKFNLSEIFELLELEVIFGTIYKNVFCSYVDQVPLNFIFSISLIMSYSLCH